MQAYWDVQIYAKHQEVRVNRVDACIINLKTKQVTTLEMSCPWARNWEEKNEKTLKYRLLRWELKQRYLGYAVPHHCNVKNFCSKLFHKETVNYSTTIKIEEQLFNSER